MAIGLPNLLWENFPIPRWILIWSCVTILVCFANIYVLIYVWLLNLGIWVERVVISGDDWFKHELDYYSYWVWDECHFHCVCLRQTNLWEASPGGFKADV